MYTDQTYEGRQEWIDTITFSKLRVSKTTHIHRHRHTQCTLVRDLKLQANKQSWRQKLCPVVIYSCIRYNYKITQESTKNWRNFRVRERLVKIFKVNDETNRIHWIYITIVDLVKLSEVVRKLTLWKFTWLVRNSMIHHTDLCPAIVAINKAIIRILCPQPLTQRILLSHALLGKKKNAWWFS